MTRNYLFIQSRSNGFLILFNSSSINENIEYFDPKHEQLFKYIQNIDNTSIKTIIASY